MPSHNKVTAVDTETYKLLHNLLGEDDFAEVIRFFCSDTKQAIETIHNAIDTGQLEHIGGVCHKLKSSSKLLGADAMAQLSIELEQCSGDGDAASLLKRLEAEFAIVSQWIESEATALLSEP